MLATLDHVLSQIGPHAEVPQEFVAILHDPDVFRVFVQRATDPAWLNWLRMAGFLQVLGETSEGMAATSLAFARMCSLMVKKTASADPATAASVVQSTRNDDALVVADLFSAVMEMPTEIAADLVPHLCELARGERVMLFARDGSALCKRLAVNGQLDAAFELTQTLFAPEFDAGAEEPRQRDQYWTVEGLRQVIPALAASKPSETLKMLCEWLDKAVAVKRWVDRETGDDGSHVWRPAIEEHPDNRPTDFAGVMVGLVRDVCEEAIRSGGLSLESVLHELRKSSFLIFRRIELHVLREFPDSDPDLVRRKLMDRELFDDYRFVHEYSRLAGRCFNQLGRDDREEWFRWVEDGPNMEGVKEAVETITNRELTEAALTERWQRDRLHWIRESLEGDWRQEYVRLVQEYGEPDMADVNVRVTSSWGREGSPITVDELKEMSFDKVVEYVCSWEPPGDDDSVSSEGLARTFGEYVAGNTQGLSEQANVLIGKRLEFVRTYVEQMVQAVGGGEGVDLASLLDLCEWIVAENEPAVTEPEYVREVRLQRETQSTRDSVVALLREVCRAKDRETEEPRYSPAEYRTRIWNLLEALCEDPEESVFVRDLDQEDFRLHDYRQLGINSSRGRAVDAAFDFVDWAGEYDRDPAGRKYLRGGWEAFPEVRSVIEREALGPERSIPVLAIIGSRIRDLYLIDRDWLGHNCSGLFDLERIETSPEKAYGWSAWNSFLVWTLPHHEYYRLFHKQFAYAVQQACELDTVEDTRERPMERLGVFLFVLYGRGKIEIDGDDPLLRRLLTEANGDIRRRAIETIGWSFHRTDDMPEHVVQRFQNLWDSYWSETGEADARDDSHLFGSWFSSGVFPAKWALSRFFAFVRENPAPEPVASVAQQLKEYGENDAQTALDILEQIVTHDAEGWRTRSFREAYRVILEGAMQAGGEYRERAVVLINKIGRMGDLELGKLLEGVDAQADSTGVIERDHQKEA